MSPPFPNRKVPYRILKFTRNPIAIQFILEKKEKCEEKVLVLIRTRKINEIILTIM